MDQQTTNITQPGPFPPGVDFREAFKALTSTDPSKAEKMSYQRLAGEEPKQSMGLKKLKCEFEKEERMLNVILIGIGVLHRAPLIKFIIPRLARAAEKCVRFYIDENATLEKNFDDFVNMVQSTNAEQYAKARKALSDRDHAPYKRIDAFKEAIVQVLKDREVVASDCDETILRALSEFGSRYHRMILERLEELEARNAPEDIQLKKKLDSLSVRLDIERGLRKQLVRERDDAEKMAKHYKVLYKSLDHYFTTVNEVHQQALEVHGSDPSAATTTPTVPTNNATASTVNNLKAAAVAVVDAKRLSNLTVISERSEDDGNSISSGTSSTSSIGPYGSLSSGSRSIPIGIDGMIAEEYIKSLGGQGHARNNSGASGLSVASGRTREHTMADFNAFASKFTIEAKETYARVTAGKHGRSKSFVRLHLPVVQVHLLTPMQ